MEAKLTATHELFSGTPFFGAILAVEVKIVNIKIHPRLKLDGYENRIDADAWNPMIMSFCDLYGLRKGRLEKSRLAEIDEELYRVPKPKEEKEVVALTGQ